MSDITIPDDPALNAVKGLAPRAAAFGRALAFLGLSIVLTLPLILTLSRAFNRGSLAALEFDPTVATVLATASFVGALAAAAIVSTWGRLSARDVGFGLAGAGRSLFVGAGLGLGLMTAVMLTLIGLGRIRLAPLDLHGLEAPLWFAGFTVFFAAVALNEELLMRGPLLTLLGRAFGFWPAAIITSLIFMALHMGNPGETPLGLANVFLVGVALAWTRRRTGSLWLAIGFHAAWDFAQSYLFGVPDSGAVFDGAITKAAISGPTWLSGGATGPEGGVLTTISTVAIFVIVNALWPKPKAAPAA
jgi:membrane protease YdiL (CAAX protease family)